ncbi:MAG: Chaperone of endosialidase [Pseudomonadota bacterium]|jgi:hypothetical protein
MAFRSSSAISENSIVFFEGGHDHDGVSSSLIDTEQYSIYDFIVGKTGSNSRQIRQQRNFDNLKTVVSNIVINDVLGPSGVRLLPNSVQSVHIAAGAITANELAANIVLVNNVISSSNYVLNTSGWAIYSNGVAEFDAASIRGTLTAAAVSTPGVDILSNGTLSANSFTLYGNGAIVTSSGNFSVSAGGVLTATGANVSGNITASAVNAGISISSPSISGGSISGTSINIGSGNFIVDSSGIMSATGASVSGTISTSNLTATGGSVAGWVISGSSLRNPSSTTILDPNGNIDIGGTLNASGNVNSGSNMNASGTIAANNEVTAGSVVRGTYFIGSGTARDTGTDVVRRSDGYYLEKTSLRELKEDIQSINDALDIVSQLTPRTFKWKARETDPDNIHTEQIKRVHKSCGFIVDEVQAVSDELLHWGIIENNGVQSLSPTMWKTDDFIALAIKGIQELNQRLSAIEQRLGYNS